MSRATLRFQNDEMRAVLKGYEEWEADIVMTSESWDTSDGLPKLTQSQYDRMIELQTMRNRVLKMRIDERQRG